MKIVELYFILFSKLHVRFSRNKDDHFYLPLLIISFIFSFNLFIISRLFIALSPFYHVGLTFLVYFFLILLFGSKRKNEKAYVRNYDLKKKTIILLIALLIIDILSLAKTINYMREQNRLTKAEKIYEKKLDFNLNEE
ncbi:hypothetical protein [Flavicella marina]|uniref:hypothetical protein n=1 Tax=Flavicella marina TaxID=1475951 RepID=UPI00126426EE|nr:hypothetical protein [Flavicella marina]